MANDTPLLLELLRACCMDGRLTTAQPSIDGGKLYATDGRVLMRATISEIPIGLPALTGPQRQAFASVLEAFDRPRHFEAPAEASYVDTISPCKSCMGINRPSQEEEGEDGDCVDCHGIGAVLLSSYELICPGVPIARRYSQLIRRLPGLRVAPASRITPTQKTYPMVAFVFDGGEGALMGISI